MTPPTHRVIPARLVASLADRYRIERELGAGGMATVYLAHDVKHDRKVAVKVLKPELAAVLGAERFIVEIRTTAALQHPHILPLFDSGEADGFLYYVMPFIDGETLRAKLDRETQLGIDEALRITGDVADALHYAHTNGVVHRDIKPENILLANGRPVVADFGIALAVSAAAGGRMTETGLSLGTPHYMSPEQATAEKEIDARSDIYSLASVLYEMLTGQPPHLGGSAQQIIMKIIAEQPVQASTLRRSVPPNVSAALGKALEKLPADRFSSAAAFSAALADTHFGAPASPARSGAKPVAGASRTLTLALAGALAVTSSVAAWALLRSPEPPPVARYAMAFPRNAMLAPDGFMLLTSDGADLVYVGPSDDGRTDFQLWLKRRESAQPIPLPGTGAAWAGALSPDDRSVAFVAGSFLRRMELIGTTSTLVASGVSNKAGSVAWLDDGTMLYSAIDGALMQVDANGGTARRVWAADSLTPWGLVPLPDARGVLFRACGAGCDLTDLYVLDLRSPDAVPRRIREDVIHAQYLDGDAILWVSGSDNVARVASFDPQQLDFSGPATPVADSVSKLAQTAYIGVSRSGRLVMLRGADPALQQLELALFDRQGREERPDPEYRFRTTRYAGDFGWALSPDGTRLAIGINSATGDDIWIKSLPRGPASRVTFATAAERRPRWTPDGRSITFVTDDGVMQRRADGSGADSLLLSGTMNEASYSPDGRWLVVRSGAMGATSGGRDLFAMRVGVDTALTPLITTEYDENAFAISPDSRWIAYESNETGRVEVFVRPFPSTQDGKVQISADGGVTPVWSRDGRELFFVRARDNAMMSARVETSASDALLAAGTPDSLFVLPEATQALLRSWYAPWDVTPDGRFVLVRAADEGATPTDSPLIVMEHWWDARRGVVRP